MCAAANWYRKEVGTGGLQVLLLLSRGNLYQPTKQLKY